MSAVSVNYTEQAIATIQQSLNWYSSQRRHWNYPPNGELQSAVRPELQRMKGALEKLQQHQFKIAAFGLVSRGKSTVINALLGQKRLNTGPLHGVTQWPETIRWVNRDNLQIDLIDTPGLDEIAGEARSEMAQSVVQQADLVLFIVAGDITNTEFTALQALRSARKPILLVFNKIDLYPDQDQRQIFDQLSSLTPSGQESPIFSPDDIVLCAANPPPIKVKVEYPDRASEAVWEQPPPQVSTLQQKILTILNRDGQRLLAYNALRQVEAAEQQIASKTLQYRRDEAERMIDQAIRYKSVAIAANPLLVIDVVGSIAADLMLIRRLARLYGLPITSFEAGRLWKKLLIGTGGVLFGPIGFSLLFGWYSLSTFWETPSMIPVYLGGALLQGGIAAYSAYIVGQAAKTYLTQGATWGNRGTSTVIRSLFQTLPTESVLWQVVSPP